MTPIRVMINGLPGNVASTIARHMERDPGIDLIPFSLTGPEIETDQFNLSGTSVALIKPDQRNTIGDVAKRHGPFISVDFTHPSAVNENASLYCAHQMPFVMGTTGGDREKLVRTVEGSTTCAVIGPNMAKQIVGFQAMMAYAAETFPDLFKGYKLTIKESHQAGKADTSGTAKAMVAHFNRMGVDFSADQIVMERDPQVQREAWKIPASYLSGHGWHTYRLTSPDGTAVFVFQHNINGREIYAAGTLDAVVFLEQQIKQGTAGRVFSMIDVLKANS